MPVLKTCFDGAICPTGVMRRAPPARPLLVGSITKISRSARSIPPAFFFAGGPQPRPGLPCALCLERADQWTQLGRGMRRDNDGVQREVTIRSRADACMMHPASTPMAASPRTRGPITPGGHCWKDRSSGLRQTGPRGYGSRASFRQRCAWPEACPGRQRGRRNTSGRRKEQGAEDQRRTIKTTEARTLRREPKGSVPANSTPACRHPGCRARTPAPRCRTARRCRSPSGRSRT